MLDNLINSFKDQLGPIISNEGLDTSKLNDVAKLSADSLGEGMMKEAASGGMDNILNLFLSESPTSQSNSMVSGVIGNLTEKLSSSFGLDASKANGIASKIIPFVIDILGKKFRDSGEHENTTAGLAEFAGLDAGGMIDKAKDLLGGKLGGLFGN